MEFLEAVLYSDDGFCIRYKDGSVLQLSSCSSAFRFYQSSSELPHIQQLTRFAVSSFRNQVISAISLRNKFACYPYLCRELLNKDSLIVNYKEIKECTWPRTALKEFVVSNDDDTVVVKSLDGHASLTLSSHKKTFRVCYLAKVNPNSTHSSQLHQKKQNLYAWVQKGEQSVDDCPDCWLYPLKMALSIGSGVQSAKEELSKLNTISKLPPSLPVTCSASHIHKWMLKEVFSGKESEEVFWQPNLKVIWKNDVTYRVYKSKKDMLKVEIYPDDGSVIFSSNFTGRFFTHCFDSKEGNMYSVDQPPPDKPGMNYSIAKLVRQGARLFNFVLQVGLHTTSQTTSQCWKSQFVDDQENIPARTTPCQILETASIPNVGRFVAYSSGHLHIAFADRTILNVRYPRGVLGPCHLKGILERDLVFNVTLPNGQVTQVRGHNMHGLERYIHLACEWGDWAHSSSHQRQSFYKDTFYDQEQRRIVESEIGKLRRFNYILNNGSLNQALMKTTKKHAMDPLKELEVADEHNQGRDELSLTNSSLDMMPSGYVTFALKKTTDTIKEIDTLLNSKTIKKII